MLKRFAIFLVVLFGLPAFVARAQAQEFPSRPLPYEAAKARLERMAAAPASTADKIVGGSPAANGKYPFQVSLLLASTKPGSEALGHFCGGSLIAEKWVLTAAHCVYNARSRETAQPNTIDVYAGSTNFRKGDRIKIARVIKHEQYDPARTDNDFALLELVRPVRAELKTRRVTLASADNEPKLAGTGNKATVIGWGTTSSGGNTSEKLLEVTIGMADASTCNANIVGARRKKALNIAERLAGIVRLDEKRWKAVEDVILNDEGTVITQAMLCAGVAEGGKDSCQGDSGGPLVIKNAKNQWVQVGVVSWGDGCGDAGLFGVYSRVSAARQWIAENMK